jgi:hypothetical protein
LYFSMLTDVIFMKTPTESGIRMGLQALLLRL